MRDYSHRMVWDLSTGNRPGIFLADHHSSVLGGNGESMVYWAALLEGSGGGWGVRDALETRIRPVYHHAASCFLQAGLGHGSVRSVHSPYSMLRIIVPWIVPHLTHDDPHLTR